MSIRTIGAAAAFLGLSVAPAFAQDGGPSTEAVEDWTVTVIHLDYANAEELAAVLSEIVPPGVTVVPYYPTNSLIVSGKRALIEELTRGGDDAARRERTDGASGEGTAGSEGDLIARR